MGLHTVLRAQDQKSRPELRKVSDDPDGTGLKSKQGANEGSKETNEEMEESRADRSSSPTTRRGSQKGSNPCLGKRADPP